MIEFYLLAFPRFPLRKKEHKSYKGKNRAHDFRTSRYADYPLDHSGVRIGFTYLQSMDFQREPQSKHHLYCEQEKPAHCHGSLLLRLGTHQIQNRTRGAHKISPHGTMTKRAPAVNWDHAVSWGGGLG